MVYIPAGVPAATSTLPVVVFGVTPGSLAGLVTVAVICAGITATPFNVSFVKAFPDLRPVYPCNGVPLKSSFTALITAGATTTVIVAMSHIVGLARSQIWSSMVYVPNAGPA